MFKKLLIIHLIIFTPLLFYNALKWGNLNTLLQQQAVLLGLKRQALSFSQIEKSNEATKSLYKNPSTQYLYSEIESFDLSSKNQKIQLIESSASESSFYTEKDENLAHPVLVDLKDLRSILKKVEDTSIQSPQKPHLIFTEFSLKKNKNSENILYDLNFKLIKREYQQ